jgi:hypothetical protein
MNSSFFCYSKLAISNNVLHSQKASPKGWSEHGSERGDLADRRHRWVRGRPWRRANSTSGHGGRTALSKGTSPAGGHRWAWGRRADSTSGHGGGGDNDELSQGSEGGDSDERSQGSGGTSRCNSQDDGRQLPPHHQRRG